MSLFGCDFRNTKTYIWDVSDLNNIELVNIYVSQLTVIDHNLYIKGQLSFQSNYMVSGYKSLYFTVVT